MLKNSEQQIPLMMGACYILFVIIGQEGEFEGNFRTEKKKQIPFLSQLATGGKEEVMVWEEE